MAMTIHVDIVSAEKEIWSGPATMVFAPGEMGELGIAPRHTPLLTRLKAGEVRVKDQHGDEESYFISGGILEIQPHVVTVLTDTAIRAEDLDEAAALKAKQDAEEAMADQKSDMDYAKAKVELAEAAAMMETIKKVRGRK
ncbi:MAG: F0F1 ATP synthase subunit epsilon [Gammaproteobacteria bacterium]|nr:F0F1 ATP synthase subunit epsilon [Gammaproteobacteria bacterium]MCW8911169.1 F0F1 ATP synthase subunit epsilon [Gammaproteobacteria bacterium]MCW9006123.1 F0F1 ATP synthase subunit epsilon [Gammaproteobacteria bacterium]MCW9055670.1 F0F1 ATP synthase subunit epsilon [Gammaproteobacteria bacterium]